MCSEEQDQLNTKKVKQLNKKKKKQDTIMSLRDQTEEIMSLHDLRKLFSEKLTLTDEVEEEAIYISLSTCWIAPLLRY